MASRGRQTAPLVHARFNAAIATHWQGLGLNVGVAEAAPEDESGTDGFMAFAVQAALDYAGVSGLGGIASRLLTGTLSETEVRERVEPFTALSSVLALTMQRRWEADTFTELNLVIPADEFKPTQLKDRIAIIIEFAYGLRDISPRAPLETKFRPVILYPIFTFASSAAYERALSVLWVTEPNSVFPPACCADPDAAKQKLAPWPLIMGSDLPANPDARAVRAAFDADIDGITCVSNRHRLAQAASLQQHDHPPGAPRQRLPPVRHGGTLQALS